MHFSNLSRPALVPTLLSTAAVLGSFAAPSFGQVSTMQTPGMPVPTAGQTTRFENDFNPAIGLVFDFFASYTDAEDDDFDGFDIDLRSAELTGAAWVDPTAWAYSAIVFAGDEVELEEAAVLYTGFDGNETLRVGRFFVDFGKQMQAHEHALRTPDRPAVLAELLGEELGGDGVQFDHWFTAGDDTIVRYSVGAFASLISHEHGEEEGEEGPEAESLERPDADELAFTARLTGFTSLTDQQTLQLGASWRGIPEFEFHDEENDAEAEGLSNHVYGVDVTWAWTDPTETETWTFGGEYLISDGDLSAETIEPVPGTFELDVLNDEAHGFYVFGDYAWDSANSAGLQFSTVEVAEAGLEDMDQIDLYYTRNVSEFQRLRFAITQTEMAGDEDLRFGVQYTAFLGPHAHGVNF